MTTYRPKPAGHDAPKTVKKAYAKPDRKLQLAFEAWLNKGFPRLYDSDYSNAQAAIKTLDASIDEAHGLLLEYQDHPLIGLAGLFLSVVYNNHPDDHIVYDVEAKQLISHIGRELPEHKTLIIDAPAGGHIGQNAAGLVITSAQTGYDTGAFSSGMIITNAYIGASPLRGASGMGIINAQAWELAGIYASGIIIANSLIGLYTGMEASGLFLTPTDPKGMDDSFKGTHIDADKIRKNEKLHEYLLRLHDATKGLRTSGDIATFKDRYGQKPQEKIKQDIECLLGRQ